MDTESLRKQIQQAYKDWQDAERQVRDKCVAIKHESGLRAAQEYEASQAPRLSRLAGIHQGLVDALSVEKD